jgi:hypothetical protein
LPDALSPAEEKILAHLLAAPSVSIAAARAGLTERAVYRHLAKPHVRAEYRRRRAELVEAAGLLLQQSLLVAAAVLRKIAADESVPPGVRVSAARTILEAGWRAGEADLAERVAALEQAGAAQPARNGRHHRVGRS